VVSVIIPVYNVCGYIDECISSICRQSYDDIEIILVDDGSTDGSAEKCNVWLNRDSRVKVIHKTNGGVSSARNAGLDVANGEYVCFLDSDDYIADNLLEVVIPYMDAGYDLVNFKYSTSGCFQGGVYFQRLLMMSCQTKTVFFSF
jgi:glycosyltransferase involved in cell wall biosynthesis